MCARRRGFPSTLGAMGDPDLRSMQLNPERTYVGEAPYGSMDPGERVKVLEPEASTPSTAIRSSGPACR